MEPALSVKGIELGSLSSRQAALVWSVALLGLVPVLAWLPAAVPPSPPAETAAAVQGYNSALAYWCAVGYVVLAALAALMVASRNPEGPILSREGCERPAGHLRPIELALLFLACLLVYNPYFLSRYGPYVEDAYFLTPVLRMHAGQVPYVDFEFLYGPLMVYPLFHWTRVFGYSLFSYYAYLALLEAAFFTTLAGLLQLLLPDRRRRWILFLLFGALFLNTLLGLNYDAWRFALPLLGLGLFVSRPADRRFAAGAALLLGVSLAYSHEFAAAAILGLFTIQALQMARTRSLGPLWHGGLIVLGVVLVWVVAAFGVMGDAALTYYRELLRLTGEFGAGASAFRFYWTLNSMALFGLLLLATIAIGSGMWRVRDHTASAGDRLLLGGWIFALVTLRSGLTRADVWHLTPVFLLVIAALVLPLPKSLFPVGRRARRLAILLLAIAALTRLVGLAPTGAFVAAGWANGAQDVLTGLPPAGARQELSTRATSVLEERSHASPGLVAMAEHLAAPDRRDRPVFFYLDRWWLGIHLGIPKTDYSSDDFMYSEGVSSSREFLARRPDALVVMDRQVYRKLYDLPGATMPSLGLVEQPSRVKEVASWLSSVHFRGVEVESELKFRLWKERVGDYIRDHYGRSTSFNGNVVLSRADTTPLPERSLP